MADITVTRERVTPRKSEQWLNANKSNRTLREGVVEQYAADMTAGDWTNCAAPIAFYEDGDVADGQHRLYAIIESGREQTFTIMRGLQRQDGLNIDTGLGRTVVDNGRISGLDTGLSAALVGVSRAVATGMGSTKDRMSNAAKLAMVAEYREACEWAISKMPHTKNICNSAIMGAVARAWYFEADHERLDKFCKAIGTGFADGDADSAAIAMRNYLLVNAGIAAGSSMWRDTFIKTQNAIHYFMRRKRLTVIKGVKDETYALRATKPAKKVARP